MSDLDLVLERLVNDPAFARHLARNRDGVLAQYALSDADRAILSTQISFEPGADSAVEDRVTKAGMAGLLSSVVDGLAGGGDVGLGGPDTAPHQDVGLGGPDTAPHQDVGYHDVEEKPQQDVGYHDVEGQGSTGPVSPAERVGFNPQPDPPGTRP